MRRCRIFPTDWASGAGAWALRAQLKTSLVYGPTGFEADFWGKCAFARWQGEPDARAILLAIAVWLQSVSVRRESQQVVCCLHTKSGQAGLQPGFCNDVCTRHMEVQWTARAISTCACNTRDITTCKYFWVQGLSLCMYTLPKPRTASLGAGQDSHTPACLHANDVVELLH